MKRSKTLIRLLRSELHYWQGQARMEARWLKQSRDKSKAIAAKMRELQKEGDHARPSIVAALPEFPDVCGPVVPGTGMDPAPAGDRSNAGASV
jgi:hypothetical protein